MRITKNHCPGPGRRLLARLSLAGTLLGMTPAVSAGFFSTFFSHDIDVLTVTYVTDAGRVYAPATPAKPVYYMIINLGLQDFGRTWAGEKIPKSRDALKWMMTAMAEQGYRLADEQHPPTQLFVFGWGLLAGGPDRQALEFLGGDKVNLMWETDFHETHSFLDPKVVLRGMLHTGVAGKVWDVAGSDLFLGIVRSFTMDSFKAPKVTLLWETRFGCPATGLALNKTLPAMIKAASLNLGRETKLPVHVNATDLFKGRSELGETKYLDTVSGPDPSLEHSGRPPPPDQR